MPATTTQLISGDRVPVGSPALVPMLLGPCPLGVAGNTYVFDPGANVAASLGAGWLAEDVLYLLRETSARVLVTVAAGTWQSAPSLTHTGTGTALISLSLAAGNSLGAYDDHSFLFTILQGGINGVARCSICYDGTTVAESITIPTEPAAVLLGPTAITPTTLALANGLTLVFAQPSAQTLTFASPSLAAAPAGLLAATATVAAPVTVTPSGMLPAGVAALAANPRVPTFTTGGTTPAHVPTTATITGTDYAGNSIGETVTPDTSAGTVSATKAYASFSVTYSAASGTDATISIGYAAAYATVAELVAEANTLAAAAPLAATASASQTSVGSFLAWTSTATGASAHLALNASPGTGASLFGFANSASATGAAATYPLANTGLVATFPATNPYILGDTFAGAAAGPRSSIAAIHTAAVAGWSQYNTNRFGFFCVPQPSDTAANCAAMVADLETLRSTWLSDPTAPKDLYFVVGSPWHVANATPATNEVNIATADAALLTAFASSGTSLNTVAVDDVYLPGALRIGTFRRSAAIAAAEKRAGAYFLAMDYAEAAIPEVLLIAPDGVTRARNENTSTVKLGGLQGPGFAVCRTMADGKSVKFVPGATRAGASSRLANPGDVAVANEVARIVQAITEGWDAQRPPVDTTSGASTFGMMTAAEKQTRSDQVDAAIRPTLKPEQGKWNCSDFSVTVSDPTSGQFLNNGKTPVTVSFIPLGEITEVDIVVAATGTTIS